MFKVVPGKYNDLPGSYIYDVHITVKTKQVSIRGKTKIALEYIFD